MSLLPLFLNVAGRTVLLIGGGRVAAAKLHQLLAVGARVRVVAPEISAEIRSIGEALADRPFDDRVGGGNPGEQLNWRTARPEPVEGRAPARGSTSAPRAEGTPRQLPSQIKRLDLHLAAKVSIAQRPFAPSDLDGVWLVVAAATSEVNRAVADAAEPRHLFVNAVDDPVNASAFLSGVVRRDGVTIAISTSGDAPALTALLREGLDALLPRDLASWIWRARAERVAWRRHGTPMEARKPLLLRALNAMYEKATVERASCDRLTPVEPWALSAAERAPRVPWLNAPEDSWL
jgi:siroheme synthase-like protein